MIILKIKRLDSYTLYITAGMHFLMRDYIRAFLVIDSAIVGNPQTHFLFSREH
jgi:hypothetical protein